ncbi:Glycogen phosphorylase [Clostridiaceae bacterium JG1575]|nr:Glycogen phosphorylase [Clostridiaceae bacterium JG1575]
MIQKTKEQFQEDFKRTLLRKFPVELEEASDYELYQALGSLVKEYQAQAWTKTQKRYRQYHEKQVYYFSIEFLLGRLLGSNLLNLGIRDVAKEALADLGLSLAAIEAVEVDPGLGNGGLGRLAAAFMDSMASSGIPGQGMGIRYKYGLFRQQFVNGYQVELPENWLRDGNVWEYRRADEAVTVKFYGDAWMEPQADGSLKCHHTGCEEVLAVPYDTALIGYENRTVNTLRLWAAEEPYSPTSEHLKAPLDYQKSLSHKRSIEAISEALYPDDSNYEGRLLRLKQEYFFVSAGIQDIVRKYKESGAPMALFHEAAAIHINDTHPALCIPEFMRILLDEEKMEWEQAWAITQKVMSYTNHTILSEALEKWPREMMRTLLPRICLIIEAIDQFMRKELLERTKDPTLVEEMAVLSGGQIRMAHLAILGSHSVNGVAKLHTDILIKQELKNFYGVYPYKFNNKTNGITHRRWLMLANPELSSLLDDAIGTSWRRNPQDLKLFKHYKRDAAMQERTARIKRNNKERLGRFILQRTGLTVDPQSIFDVQVKRLHAYKRQLLNALHILHLYHELLENPNLDLWPRTFIFAAKAAPAYYYAKEIIKFINSLAKTINEDPRIGGRIKVVFLENYGVSLAERIIPAAEVSEQISLTTKEASGTSNMKFMMNGAVTLATLDGANVEILREVGEPNIVIFGLNEQEVLDYHRSGGYISRDLYNSNEKIRRVLDSLINGFIPGIASEGHDLFQSLVDYNDEYFLLKDFEAYAAAQERINGYYQDAFLWNKISIENISSSGAFSSDNTVRQYASGIWETRIMER